MKTTLTIIAFLYSCLVFAQDPPEKYQKIWAEVNEGDSKKAKKELSKSIKNNPEDPWLYWMSGILINNGTDQGDAKTFYEKALAVDSTFGPAYYSLASLLDDDSNTDKKIELFSKAIKFYPQNGFSYVARGELYLKKGLYELAMTDAESAKKSELIDLMAVDGLIIEVLYAQKKTRELHAFIKSGNYTDSVFMWDTHTINILISVYEELNQPENVCKVCKSILEDYDMVGIPVPETISEKLKKCK
ncbi:hypothetical protein [Fluviicola sp.]|uniref:tetratricopeptide repeat protein n=1 Tax=Fluviicola sp. TaxID=1917219 RepID=UPI00262DE829|nr:hypothetical protein [Fluviicola sp.]